jgi:Ankyrin repeats (3 copies)
MLYEKNNINVDTINNPINNIIFASHPIYSESIPQERNQSIPIPLQNQTTEAEGVGSLNSKNFRIVYQKGSFLDAPNLFGNTLLHQALRAKDYELVKDLLENKIVIDSVNFAYQGMTPLMIAIEMEEEAMIELLLNHGAGSSINKEHPVTLKTSLHMAATLRNSHIARLLLKHGAANSILLKDKKEYTPLQRAIIVGNVDSVKAMLEYCPEIGKNLNKPDFYGVTDIQRAARSGNIEMVDLLLAHTIEEEIEVNILASFTAGDLEACQMETMSLDDIPVDQVEFPLVIAQNFCSVMLRLNTGEIWKIPHADAQEVRNHIMEKKFGDQAIDHLGTNVLTLFLNRGHGFLRLECRNCDEGKSHNQNHGFYPLNNIFLQPRKIEPQNRSKPDFIFNLVESHERGFKDQKGGEGNDDSSEHEADSRNYLKIMFYVDDKQAKAALTRIQEVSDACRQEPIGKPCIYNAFRHNCVSYVQKVYQSIGGKGYFAELFTSEQLDYGHFLTPWRIADYQAVSYAYVRSRWFAENNEDYQNHLTNATLRENHSIAAQITQPHPMKPISLGSALLWGVVLPAAVSCAFDYLSRIWNWQGESVSREDFDQWYHETSFMDHALSSNLDELERVISEMRKSISDEIASIKGAEKLNEAALYQNEIEQVKWRNWDHKRIDLLCDRYVLKAEIKELYKNKTLPSKNYLEKLDERITQLHIQCEELWTEVDAE